MYRTVIEIDGSVRKEYYNQTNIMPGAEGNIVLFSSATRTTWDIITNSETLVMLTGTALQGFQWLCDYAELGTAPDASGFFGGSDCKITVYLTSSDEWAKVQSGTIAPNPVTTAVSEVSATIITETMVPNAAVFYILGE